MSGQTILVVDDSAAVRRAVSLMASGAGYTCVEAADGAEALKQLKAHEVDLVLTDLNMPVMDGREFISKLRAMPEMRFMPVLVLTTECSEDVASDLKRSGVTGVLQKPIARAELLAALSRAGA
jgi:two-component system, chemotaxis family, chemotaxis protein CheY